MVGTKYLSPALGYFPHPAHRVPSPALRATSPRGRSELVYCVLSLSCDPKEGKVNDFTCGVSI